MRHRSIGRTPAAWSAFLSVVSLMSSVGHAADAPKPNRVLSLAPISMSANGDIQARVVGTDDIYSWNAADKKLTPTFLSQGTLNTSGYATAATSGLKTSSSEDGSVVLALRTLQVAPFSELFLITANQQGSYVAAGLKETRVLTSAPQISPDLQAYTLVAKTDPNQYYGTQGLWLFDLAEYLWDLQNGMPQPTGYYLQPIVVPKASQPSNPYATSYGDNILSSAWSSDSRKVAYAIQSYDATRYGYGAVTIKVYDRDTQATDTIGTVTGSIAQMKWVGDSIYYVSSNTGYTYYGGQLSRMDVKKKTSETVISSSIDSDSFEISTDGKWILYSLASSTTYGTPVLAKPTTLHDVSSKRGYTLEGVSSAVFAKEGKSLIMQRKVSEVANPGAAFLLADISDLIAKARISSIDVQSLGTALTSMGQPLMSYPAPTDKAEFQKVIQMTDIKVNASGPYSYITAQLSNVSNQYYSFEVPTYSGAKCSLYDDKGNLISPAPYPSYPSPTKTWITWGPKKQMSVSCNASLGGFIQPGTKIKLVLELPDYSKGAVFEKEIEL